MLRHEQQQLPAGERRYDQETLQKVTSLALRLQDQHQETYSSREIEAAGAEVGLEPAFVREALARMTPQAEKAVRVRPQDHKKKTALLAAWWSAGWAVPLMALMMVSSFAAKTLGLVSFFGGMAVYIGVGVYLSAMHGGPEPAEAKSLTREELLKTLFALERQLEAGKVRRTFLSIDVAGSTLMKEGEPDLAVEYSFGRFREWVRRVVEACGGSFHTAAGDGTMSAFPDDASALRAARRVLEGIGRFNAEQNRLSRPFQVRCGVNAGEVALEADTPLGHVNSTVVDLAAALQKQAEPGDIVVGESVAAAALSELGTLSRLPEPVSGQLGFSWRRGGYGP